MSSNSMPSQVGGAVEFRVLTGSQSGCRLVLRGGTYTAGAADTCDLLLDDVGADSPAFILFVGHREIALEAVAADMQLAGRTLIGMAPLGPGETFFLGNAAFAVDEVDAPWPSPEEIEAARLPAAEEDISAASEEDPPSQPPTDKALPEPAPASEPAPPAAPPAAGRVAKRRPLWVIWLGGTTAFILIALSILVASLTPSSANVPQVQANVIDAALQRIISGAAAFAQVKLERRPDGSRRLTGHVKTREQQIELVRAIRAADPEAHIQIASDDDIAARAKETLARFPGLEISLTSVKLGQMTLQGHVKKAAQRDDVSRAMFDDIPGLVTIHSEVSADDDAAVTLNELLAAAGLAGQIKGRIDGSQLIVAGTLPKAKLPDWQDIRSTIEKRFGPQLSIVENLSDAPAVRSQPILAVLGPVPYVLLATGEIEGRSREESAP